MIKSDIQYCVQDLEYNECRNTWGTHAFLIYHKHYLLKSGTKIFYTYKKGIIFPRF